MVVAEVEKEAPAMMTFDVALAIFSCYVLTASSVIWSWRQDSSFGELARLNSHYAIRAWIEIEIWLMGASNAFSQELCKRCLMPVRTARRIRENGDMKMYPLRCLKAMTSF